MERREVRGHLGHQGCLASLDLEEKQDKLEVQAPLASKDYQDK